MKTKDNYAGIDLFRIPAALLVVAIHTSPLDDWGAEGDFFLTRVFARIAVPFFFMVTGQFVLSDYLWKKKKSLVGIWRYIRKLLILYGISIVLYLPIGMYAGHYENLTLPSALRLLLFDGTFYHLWYFPACIIGILLVCIVSRFLNIRGTFLVGCFLYLIGLFGDSYFGLTTKIPVLAAIYEKGFTVWSYTRNGLFLAPVFLILGAIVGNGNKCKKKASAYAGFLGSLMLMTVEAFTLRHFGFQRHDSMYFMLIPTMIFLYQILLMSSMPQVDWKKGHMLRTTATGIYIIHPAIITVVRGIAKISGVPLLTDNSFLYYLCVGIFSALAAIFITVLLQGRKRQGFYQGRAWIEIDRNALEKNVAFLKAGLPQNCKLMPAIKADAYGHGAIALAKELCRMGVDAFCVACVQEGIALRRAGIRGEILVLGYTHPIQFGELRKYHLSQTVIDDSYAKLLRKYGKRLHVHVGVDTGMHRLGERCENIEQICNIFKMRNLIVDGIFTHLSADDAVEKAEKEFTDRQAMQFYEVLDALKKRGIQCPKVHLQASYGVLNYPELAGDYARVGIALYGVLSAKEDTLAWREKLCPVLSLKTRVAAVKEIYPGETAGYGLSFTADRTMKIAALAIGYADGFPRSLSDGKGAVLIHGKIAPVIGKICMDQTLVDVSDIRNIQTGDIAVVIGKSGNMEITVCDLAEQAGTITNEILSRMGARLERVMVFPGDCS